MPFPTFKNLLKLLSLFFEVDIAQANQISKGHGYISPELICTVYFDMLLEDVFMTLEPRQGYQNPIF
jgi:hypothetical protein